MSWRNRLFTVACVGLLGMGLAGCGFRPLYADHSDDGLDTALASVQVDQLRDRLGQVLTNQLRDGFNPTSVGIAARYQLQVVVGKAEYDSAIRADGTASHTAVVVTGDYKLIDLADGKQVLAGRAQANNGLDVLDNQYANTIGEKTEELRAIHDVGEQIHQKVAIYLHKIASKS